MMFIFYKLAAGVVLYYTVQQFLSIIQQWLAMRKADNTTPATPLVSAGKAK
jgi:membrane protein insertase Oxa1/YidC/SpoIIIJ